MNWTFDTNVRESLGDVNGWPGPELHLRSLPPRSRSTNHADTTNEGAAHEKNILSHSHSHVVGVSLSRCWQSECTGGRHKAVWHLPRGREARAVYCLEGEHGTPRARERPGCVSMTLIAWRTSVLTTMNLTLSVTALWSPTYLSVWVLLSTVLVTVFKLWPDTDTGSSTVLGYLRPLPAIAACLLPVLYYIDWPCPAKVRPPLPRSHPTQTVRRNRPRFS